MPDPSSIDWSHVGVGGFIALVAITAIILLTKRFLDYLKDSETNHRQERENVATLHRDERKAWEGRTDARSSKTDLVIGELKNAIKDIARNHT